ncbi:N-acetylneuraminate synthase [Candidatus Magnetobacterium bavaricum]|uniref:N-acetylneuraminate synthase n=1 Tax=Candidatus Magnetobacterium bavaricum TaxID=29290 RepID=A0A0F3GKZ7_9BACT|nr:N-acetylneuraminate synthase [Candidatus Magnetobacterium bavaricum]
MDISIGNKVIGKHQPVFIIAEACDNHFGNLDVAKEMILQAKLSGVDSIKFQHHLPDEEMLPDIVMSDNFKEPLYEFLKKHALTLQQHNILKSYCEEVGIIYLCTPFSYAAAKDLYGIGIKAFKIGSGEMTDHISLKAIAALGLPMILSTGMCTLDEIRETYIAIKNTGTRFCFTNCVSEYPPVYDDMNIGFIKIMQDEFPDIVIGHSDHTPDLYTSFASVALGAKIIEKHIILDKTMPGPDQSVSIDMKELAELVDGIRKIEAAMGSKKKVHDNEKQIRKWAFRSIVTTCDIMPGTVLTEEMLWTKRPGTGIPSKELPSFIGKKVNRFFKANTLLTRDGIEKD